MPLYDIVERHHIRVVAGADITLAAACEQDLTAFVRMVFKAREILLGSEPDRAAHPRGLLALTKSIGWGVLAEVPGREIVMGAVTQPWYANVVFRPLPPSEFVAFNEPGYVKIVWTLEPIQSARADRSFALKRVPSRRKRPRERSFEYWSFLSPGIILIRWASLGPLKREAERRARGVQLIEAPAVEVEGRS